MTKAWYAKVKDDNSPDLVEKPTTSPLDVEMALEELGANPNWKSGLDGNLGDLELYERVHPLGRNQTVAEAAKDMNKPKRWGFRALERLKSKNPDLYDLDKWPTKDQLDAYRLIHPEFGGLSQEDAAKLLGIGQPALCERLSKMRESFPGAFSFERMAEPEMLSYDPDKHDEYIVRKF